VTTKHSNKTRHKTSWASELPREGHGPSEMSSRSWTDSDWR